MTLEKHQINTNLLTRKNESEILSRHEYAFIKSHAFLQKKKFLRQNIDDVREQNELQKKTMISMFELKRKTLKK